MTFIIEISARKTRTQAERIQLQSKRGIKSHFPQSRLQRKSDTRRKRPCRKITMAFAAVVFACVASLRSLEANGNRQDNGYTKSAQYCVPQFLMTIRMR